MVLRAVSGGASDAPVTVDGGIEVGFVGRNGSQARMSLAEVADVPFEAAAPVRAFPSFKRQRHFPGFPGGQLGCGSLLHM